MSPVNERTKQVKETRAQLEQDASVQAIKAALKGQAQLLRLLTEQQGELKALRQDVARLGRGRSGGGLPWGLLLLAGGAYALYRFSPEVHHRVNSLLGQADPGVEGNLKRAGTAARDAIDDLQDGPPSGDALHRVGGELRRAGEKTADRLKDGLDDLKDKAKDRLDGRPG